MKYERELSEEDAFKEYFESISVGSTPTHFQSVDELLGIFPEAQIENIEHYAAGNDPVNCSGGSIFHFSGGLTASGKVGSGQNSITTAQADNNALYHSLNK